MKVIQFKLKYLKIKNIAILLIPIFIICSISIFNSINKSNLHYSMDYDNNINIANQPISFYFKNNSIYSAENDDTIIKLCDNISNANFAVGQSNFQQNLYINYYLINDTSFFFIVSNSTANTSALYKYEVGKNIIKIDENVNSFVILAQQNKKMFYLKTSDKDPNLGTLYLYENNKKTKITKDNCKVTSYHVTSDGSHIAYVESNSKTLIDSIYVEKVTGKRTLIAQHKDLNILDISSNASAIFYSQGSAQQIYSKIIGKPAELITTKVFQYVLMPKDMSLFFIGDYSTTSKLYTLYYKELNKNAVKIDTNVSGLNSFYDIYEKKSHDLAVTNSSINKEILYTKKLPDNYNSVNYLSYGSKPTKLFSSQIDNNYVNVIKSSLNNDFSNIVSNDSKIIIDKINLNNKTQLPQTVINGNRCYPNISSEASFFNDIFFTTTDTKKAELHNYSIKDNKDYFLLPDANNLTTFFMDKGIVYYLKNDEFWVKEPNKDPIKISSAERIFSTNNNAYFYKKIGGDNFSYELYKYTVGETPKLIASGIEFIQ